MLYIDQILADDLLVTVQHKVRDLEEPAVYSVYVCMYFGGFCSCLLSSLISGLRKGKFERTYQLYVQHYCALDGKFSQFLYEWIIVVNFRRCFDLSENEAIDDLGLDIFSHWFLTWSQLRRPSRSNQQTIQTLLWRSLFFGLYHLFLTLLVNIILPFILLTVQRAIALRSISLTSITILIIFNILQFNYRFDSQASLVPCWCGRTFFPERLAVHQKGCKPPPGKENMVG